MRVLFVTPVTLGSGETITAIHMAEALAADGDDVHFLASPFAESFVRESFPESVTELSESGGDHLETWRRTVEGFRPDVVVFADYALMEASTGCLPLSRQPGWEEALEATPGRLVTLDHFGFTSMSEGFFVGPPHLGLQYFSAPRLPEDVEVLLPCPMHEPGPVDGRVGRPFRSWPLPRGAPDARKAEARRRHLDDPDDFLVLHPVSTWATRLAEDAGLTLYDQLPRLFEAYLGDAARPVTVVSVNGGDLLEAEPGASVSVVNLDTLSKSEFEALLFAADLVLTENRLSISLGKAVCGFQTCAAWHNSHRLHELAARDPKGGGEAVQAMERDRLGSVYPWAVYPSLTPDDVEEIGLYRDNSLPEAFLDVEIFGGEETGRLLRDALEGGEVTERLESRQRAYVERLRELPASEEVLRRVAGEPGGR